MLTAKQRDQLGLLRVEAAHQRLVIKVHAPITGEFFTLRDADTDTEVGRYDTLLQLDDALIAGIGQQDDQRDAAL